MSSRVSLALLLALLLAGGWAGAGCGGSGSASDAVASGDAAEGGHEPPRGGAASAEAWCGEHGVLEAVCTLCNPKLAAIFQAKGDWCVEHGLPESFCPTCHPERGGRPAVALSPETAPPQGMNVQLRSAAAVAAADIATEPARAPDEASVLEVLATIAYDPSRRAQVNPRLPGVVRTIHVEAGAIVAEGDALATIASAEVAALQSRLAGGRARKSAAEAALTRAESLLESGLGSKKDLADAERERAESVAELAGVQAELALVGVEEGLAAEYTLRAPMAGSVLVVAAAAGRMVDAEDVLCELVDASTLWAELDLPEAELGRVTRGLDVRVSVDALPGREFTGTIETIAPEVDARTRTARARVRLANPDGALRANMFARARIRLPKSSARALVPAGALQRAGGAALVFVQLAADRYEVRRVSVGRGGDGLVEILDGVRPGEPVATRGSFLLKTETLRGSIGAGCCEPE